MALLVGGDVWFVLQSQADVVKSFEQDRLAEIVDIEMECQSLLVAHGLLGKIRSELISDIGFHAAKEFIHLHIGQSDGQDTVLEAIVIKNISKTRSDDYAEAIIEQRPGRMFAARSTAKIRA